MSFGRILSIAVVGALLVIAALTLRPAISLLIASPAATDSFDEVEHSRANFHPSVTTDLSYDEVERIRASYTAVGVDTSYDEVEHNRAVIGGAPLADTSYDEVERIRTLFR